MPNAEVQSSFISSIVELVVMLVGTLQQADSLRYLSVNRDGFDHQMRHLAAGPPSLLTEV